MIAKHRTVDIMNTTMLYKNSEDKKKSLEVLSCAIKDGKNKGVVLGLKYREGGKNLTGLSEDSAKIIFKAILDRISVKENFIESLRASLSYTFSLYGLEECEYRNSLLWQESATEAQINAFFEEAANGNEEWPDGSILEEPSCYCFKNEQLQALAEL